MIEPMPLPYWNVEPVISADALALHYALYSRYVERALAHPQSQGWRDLADAQSWAKQAGDLVLLFNVQQAQNHELFFQSMWPEEGPVPQPRLPDGHVAQLLLTRWGSYDAFRAEFVARLTGIMASGWLWVVAHGPTVGLWPTADSGQPDPAWRRLLVCDAFEHAFILDYGIEKQAYAQNWIDFAVDWGFAEGRLAG
jgi:Fe-Mn family superoxide dismutase